MGAAKEKLGEVHIVEYDAQWPSIFISERDRILSSPTVSFSDFEHVGSTAVPGLRAKPIIDMMASVAHLSDVEAFMPALNRLGYECIDVGFRTRIFLRKHPQDGGCGYHLHIVTAATWPERNERLLRDHLIATRDAARAYAELKTRLAIQFPDDSPAYTKAKTDLIQQMVDAARDRKGLPRMEVWEE